jgi:hypothetical protein
MKKEKPTPGAMGEVLAPEVGFSNGRRNQVGLIQAQCMW